MSQPINDTSPKFSLGQIVATRGAIQTLAPEHIYLALCRHVSGDWGTLDESDREANETALQNGSRLFSVYYTESGVKFYVITEWDRSVTTVLLPEDY